MNGKKLDRYSREMQAMIAYLIWVGKDVKKGVKPVGALIADIQFLERPADPVLGEIGFRNHCIVCHGAEGQGILNNDSVTYRYPPLWGPNSYSKKAGMYRLSRFAGFIKYNMPYEASSVDKPALTNAESWDIAAFVNSRPRPDRTFEGEWPDISKKPIDSPSGPYSDRFSEKQHKYGPYQKIIEAKQKH
jgi:thiosulfate dehydrogenase